MKNTIQDLLTENRYWTFWSNDWSKCIYVVWNGKTKFKEVLDTMHGHLGKSFRYERQVELKEADLTFA